MRLPTYAQLRAFCEHDHWDPKSRTDHWRYTKKIDGKLWRTKVSFGTGQINDPSMFAHILRDQLNVDHDEFWRVVDGDGPARRPTTDVVTAQELPAWLVAGLLKEGVVPEKVKSLTETAARDLLTNLRSRPRR